MTADNQKLGQERHGEERHGEDLLGQDFHGGDVDLNRLASTGAVDFAFLMAQTFEDTHLERDVLELFVAQARKILPGLPGQTASEQADAAHLLKGSARGIGAWLMAEAAERYEATPAATRHLVFPGLAQAFASTQIAISARLAALKN